MRWSRGVEYGQDIWGGWRYLCRAFWRSAIAAGGKPIAAGGAGSTIGGKTGAAGGTGAAEGPGIRITGHSIATVAAAARGLRS